MIGCCRKFIAHYGSIIKPLTKLLMKNNATTFQKLEQAMSSTTIFVLPNFRETFFVETDASYLGIGVVLMQRGMPLAFLSKAFGSKNKGSPTHNKGVNSNSYGISGNIIFFQIHFFIKVSSLEFHLK
ncbi:hypothetical protein Nepgr_001098 [Nepenthes gracilis]|uniref:Reverse transcriptase/retrotransposon-derived protein RNase H-like domain-containing protein n=1 Tax=Nepenthes gracilis TaxID=150966 RepID=A0AAD3P7M6_NEPGR|nr:hypothetical protein Nepgr_001098 [Nepenthes gracilis]